MTSVNNQTKLQCLNNKSGTRTVSIAHEFTKRFYNTSITDAQKSVVLEDRNCIFYFVEKETVLLMDSVTSPKSPSWPVAELGEK